jgi:thymidylate synthase ThyX
MSYLEQSTRYISYDARLGGRYRYYRDPACSPARSAPATSATSTGSSMRTAVASMPSPNTFAASVQRGPDDSEFVYRTATRAKALDAVRGILPAAATSNVGIYGTGQAFEALLLRMRSNPLPERASTPT